MLTMRKNWLVNSVEISITLNQIWILKTSLKTEFKLDFFLFLLIFQINWLVNRKVFILISVQCYLYCQIENCAKKKKEKKNIHGRYTRIVVWVIRKRIICIEYNVHFVVLSVKFRSKWNIRLASIINNSNLFMENSINLKLNFCFVMISLKFLLFTK